MKKIIAALLIAIAALLPMKLDNDYLRCSNFDTVTVKQGESVHELANRYTINASEREKLVEAICEINDIHVNTALQEGRKLRIPMPSDDSGSAIAQK